MLRKWKQTAEDQSFRAIVAPYAARSQRLAPIALDTADRELIETLGLPAQDDLEAVIGRLIGAARADLNAFKGTPRWPRHAIALNLRMTTGDSVRAFHASALAEAIQTFNEIVVVARREPASQRRCFRLRRPHSPKESRLPSLFHLANGRRSPIPFYNPWCAVTHLSGSGRST